MLRVGLASVRRVHGLTRLGALLFGGILPLSGAYALQAPDATELQQEWQKNPNRKAQATTQFFFRRQGGDSLSLVLAWKNEDKQVLNYARYEQNDPFDPDNFTNLAVQYGGGGSWHELPDPFPQSVELKAYPGLRQQWRLEGYGGEIGWAGSGLIGHRYYLVFADKPPLKQPEATGPLAIHSNLTQCFDTASAWLKIPCTPSPQAAAEGLKPRCYSPADNPRLVITIEGGAASSPSKTPQQIRLVTDDGDALPDVQAAIVTLPAGSEVSYAQDLAAILKGDAQFMLARLAQNAPCLFNQPSWFFTRMKEGQVAAKSYLPFLGPNGKKQWEGETPTHSRLGLPALDYQGSRLHLQAEKILSGGYKVVIDVINP